MMKGSGIKREPAMRIFASELSDSEHELEGEGEKAPSYVITPLGAKVNRVFIVGVLTQIENSGTENEPFIRARVSDPSGVFFLTTGQYQPEATQAIMKLKDKVPTIVAVVGKIKTYSPEEGVKYISVRPEIIREVTKETRDYWLLDASKATKERIDALREASSTDKPTIDGLRAKGFRRSTAEGALNALQLYTKPDVDKYAEMVSDSLSYLLPGAKTEDITPPKPKAANGDTTGAKPAAPKAAASLTPAAPQTAAPKAPAHSTASHSAPAPNHPNQKKEEPAALEMVADVIDDEEAAEGEGGKGAALGAGKNGTAGGANSKLGKLKPGGAGSPDADALIDKYSDAIIAAISAKDKKGRGANINDVKESVKASKSIPNSKIDAVIESMLDKGMLYEPIIGMIKKV